MSDSFVLCAIAFIIFVTYFNDVYLIVTIAYEQHHIQYSTSTWEGVVEQWGQLVLLFAPA